MALFDEDDDLNDLNDPQMDQAGGEAAAQPSSGGNRNFLLAIGILAALFLLLVIGVVVALNLLRNPARQVSQQATNASIQSTNESIIAAATQTADVLAQINAQLLTPSATLLPTNTQIPPTATMVVAKPSATPTMPSDGDRNRTATVSALLTQAAGKMTQTPGGATATVSATATELPKTGFADEVGLPGLFGMAIVLVVVVLVARRLRLTPGS